MLIEFKIQWDDGSGATVVPASASSIDSSAPKTVQLSSSASSPAATAPSPVGAKPTAVPTDGPGPGPHPGAGAGAGVALGSGTVFVIGPIVICGSAPGQTGAGGAVPTDGPGTGTPKTGSETASK
jgi:hypothetical protein